MAPAPPSLKQKQCTYIYNTNTNFRIHYSSILLDVSKRSTLVVVD